MNSIHLYLIGAGSSVLLSALLVRILRGSLADLLEELWASRARAAFWAAVFCVSILLLGVFAGTGTSAYGRGELLASGAGFFALAGQLRSALFGLFLALILVAFVVTRFMIGADRSQKEGARSESLPSA